MCLVPQRFRHYCKDDVVRWWEMMLLLSEQARKSSLSIFSSTFLFSVTERCSRPVSAIRGFLFLFVYFSLYASLLSSLLSFSFWPGRKCGSSSRSRSGSRLVISPAGSWRFCPRPALLLGWTGSRNISPDNRHKADEAQLGDMHFSHREGKDICYSRSGWSCCFGPFWRFRRPPVKDWTAGWCLWRADEQRDKKKYISRRGKKKVTKKLIYL